MTPLLHIASARGVPGTAGALVVDRDGTRFVLASHHVVFGGGATAGDCVWALAPAVVQAPRAAVCLGRARHGVLGRVTFGGSACFVDCALVELDDARRFPAWLVRALDNPWPTQTARPAPSQRVLKEGATTGRTEGVVVDTAFEDCPFVEEQWWTAPGQLRIASRDPELNFSAPGDSGAAVVDERGRLVGLLWGSNGEGHGLACPIAPVLDCLGVELARTMRD